MNNIDLINNLITNQNKLLEQMNGLIERQNQILQNQQSTTTREVFVNDIDHDEMRNGFLVTSHRKKLWNVQIGLINEFARVCKKHNLKWFAFYGTLLGAARHKGFIPWDDDSDVVMFRPDYEKFKRIAAEELKYPYRLYNWYDYSHEADGEISSEYEKTLPLITIRQTIECPMWWPCRPMMRIVDPRTTMLSFDARKKLYTGIWLDIFPLDSVTPFSDERQAANFETARELLIATVYPQNVKKVIENNQRLLVSAKVLNEFIKKSYRQKGIFFDNFMDKTFHASGSVGLISKFCFPEDSPPATHEVKNFEKTVYLPFEKI